MAIEETRRSLLSRLRDPSDESAWSEFDRGYGELIVSFCRRRGLQASDAEDVRQMVLAKLMGSLQRFQYSPERGRFRDYLHRVVRGEIARLRTRHTPPSAEVRQDEEATEDRELEQQWDQEWMRHHFRRAWEEVRTTLGAQSLEVFRRLLHGDPAPAVAAALGVTPAAVRKVKERVSRKLKDAIRRQIEDEEAREE